MSFIFSGQGTTDQIGGNFTFPAPILHIPSFNGNFITLPPGLIIGGDRRYTWSIVSLTNGIIGITGEKTESPVIEVDSNVYSNPTLTLRVTRDGQPQNFSDFIIFTAITGTPNLLQPGFSSYIESHSSATNLIIEPAVSSDSSSGVGSLYSGGFVLVWDVPPSTRYESIVIEKYSPGIGYQSFLTLPVSDPNFRPKRLTTSITDINSTYRLRTFTSNSIQTFHSVATYLGDGRSTGDLLIGQDLFSNLLNSGVNLNAEGMSFDQNILENRTFFNFETQQDVIDPQGSVLLSFVVTANTSYDENITNPFSFFNDAIFNNQEEFLFPVLGRGIVDVTLGGSSYDQLILETRSFFNNGIGV